MMVNPFASQMPLSWPQRLAQCGIQYEILAEQYRPTEGLADVLNRIFYDNKITNAECTKIMNCPTAQAAVRFIPTVFNKNDEIPHIYIHIPEGVCRTQNPRKSVTKFCQQ